MFRRPQGKPTSPSLDLPVPRDKPTDTEDDEGIHSHDGGSDISDSVSEGSDDSGTGKLADPETPTDEIPTPTELKCHTCIFCDRTFPMEVDYRRHLNRRVWGRPRCPELKLGGEPRLQQHRSERDHWFPQKQTPSHDSG